MANLENINEQIKKLQQQKRNALKKAEIDLKNAVLLRLFNNNEELMKKVISSNNVEIIIDGNKIN